MNMGTIFLILLLCIQTTNAQYYNNVPAPTITPAPTTVAPAPTSTLASQFLGPQNAARVKVGLPRLTWDSNLARYAQWWANKRKYDCALIHSTSNYGENIFWGSGTDWTASQAATAWIVEKKYYNVYGNSCANGQQCGHYTQIVWKSSKRIGCGRVVCPGGKGVFMICNYDPPGNYIGERPY